LTSRLQCGEGLDTIVKAPSLSPELKNIESTSSLDQDLRGIVIFDEVVSLPEEWSEEEDQR
jgi:hypothetical protein